MSDSDSLYHEFLEAFSHFRYGNGDVPAQELVYHCLLYSFATGEPLPREMISLLIREFAVIQSGWDSPLFEKPKSQTGNTKKPTTHPEAITLERWAVSYVKTNRKMGWDKTPIATVCSVFGVARSTYYRWENKYPTERDDCTKEGMSLFLEQIAPLYPQKKSP
jgi:hypothetical protein